MKKCPFCKKEIGNNISSCPYCTRIILEKIIISNISKNNIKAERVDVKYKETEFNNKHQNDHSYIKKQWEKDSSNILWIIGIITVFILMIVFDNSSKENITTQQIPTINEPSSIPSHPIYSLKNGESLLENSSFLSGEGQLKIKNGTNFDALAKLINKQDKSIKTVYIKAKNNYTIQNISDGNYKLVFLLGSDWNKAKITFNENRSYSKFDDYFNFKTTSKSYSIWGVTLNPIVGGTAKTSPLDENEFENY